MLILLSVFVFFILMGLCFFMFKSIVIVPQSCEYVIERLGAYLRTLQAGMNHINPFVDKIARKVSLKEQVVAFSPQPVITKDNVTVQIDTVVFYQVTDVKLYAYGVENPMSAIENLTITALRNIIGELELDETLSARELINKKIAIVLDQATDRWGIKILRVELRNILPPIEIMRAMEMQMRAEREKRSQILLAEAEKEKMYLKAESLKENEIQRAEAMSKALEIVRDELSKTLEHLNKDRPVPPISLEDIKLYMSNKWGFWD